MEGSILGDFMVLVGIWSTGWMHWIERGANMDL